ncbi:hypothetical protein Pan258_13640 [Symmachiella dynata]|uniref:DUF4276 family protein n=1 Tax=Symmachiella dynata TaxID=2527995 RepID=UPI00118C8488|nr:DUF4276 family protein [Symmachiella dynata]QDT47331.1 hypothetical protein Pan258_13640 [Symmachiella dynata]
MKVLVVSEGKHEISTPSYPLDITAALPTLTTRLLKRELEITSKKVSSNEVKSHRIPGKGGGYTKRALAWIRYADRNGFEALVLVVDQDGDTEREAQLHHAHADDRLKFPRAIGVAVKQFDAWMLTDEKALTKVLGVQVNRQSDPENNANPKQTCRGLLDQCNDELSQTEMYARVAQEVDLDLLKGRCPRGFAAFAQRVEALPCD